jgi:RimJ/RimL family protein N-acetyltransferase
VPWQRQGYAEEVCRAVLDFGRQELGFERVQVLVETENEPSLSLCRKLGFSGDEIVELDGRKHFRMMKSFSTKE